MNKAYILVEGYARPGDGAYLASSTSVLIETEDKKILVDPGVNKELLLRALNNLNVQENKISFVYLTHYHPDHFLNVRLFPDLDVYDGTTRWVKDEEYNHEGVIPGTDIEILNTPGHSPEHTSLLVKTEDGVVCIAGDVFLWEDGKQDISTTETLINLEDPFASDVETLKQSRKLVLERADMVIPGHGKPFKNPFKTQ